SALRRLARDLGVAGQVSFEPVIPHAEVAAAYRCADVGISPQADHLFGDIYFSTKVAEYLAVGLPAVVARTPVMAHYYDDSHVALLHASALALFGEDCTAPSCGSMPSPPMSGAPDPWVLYWQLPALVVSPGRRTLLPAMMELVTLSPAPSM